MNLKNRNLTEIFSDSPSSMEGQDVTLMCMTPHVYPTSTQVKFFLFSSTGKGLMRNLFPMPEGW